VAIPDSGFQFTMTQECGLEPDGSFRDKLITDTDGGQTRFGVDSKSHPEAVGDGFYGMSKFDALKYAEAVYTDCYWTPAFAHGIQDQSLATKFVDLAFNEGIEQATKLVQQAINSCRSTVNQLLVDGRPGPETIAAINAVDPHSLMDAIIIYGQIFYTQLRDEHPERYSNFVLASWIKRLHTIP